VKSILEIRPARRAAEDAAEICLVLAEQHLRLFVGVQPVMADDRVHGVDLASFADRQPRFRPRIVLPRPGVAKPELWQDVNRRLLGAAVVRGDSHQNVRRGPLRIFDEDVEITVIVEDPRVEQLEFGIGLAAPRIFFD
jgi:hypothetical protein